jgi:Flp pilus assembly protein TadD
MRRLLLAVTLLWVSGASTAAAQTWTHAESEHFEVYTTGGDRTARDALTYFERVHAFFTDFMKIAPQTTARTRLIVFTGDRQFAPYKPGDLAVAFYQSGPERDYIVMRALDSEAYPIVVHEYVHLVLRHSPGTYPLWLNEGLAEFFSTLAAEGNRMGIGKPPIGRLAYITQEASMMPLDRLFGVTHGSPEYLGRSHSGVFYSQSWALTHMLFVDSRYKAGMGEFTRLVVNGMPSADALMKVYGKTPENVGRDLYNYVRQSQYTYFLADYRSPEAVRNRPTRRVDTFEADLVRANLLANMRERESDARTVFERLSGERPDDLTLLESRAFFEMQHGRMEQARPHLRRATELGSTNPWVYRTYAVIEPERRSELLTRAFEMSPDNLELRLQYASLRLSEKRPGEALAALSAVRNVPQELAFQLFQLQANVYASLDEFDEARRAAERAVQYAATEEEAAFAARLRKSLDDFVAARAAAAERANARAARQSDADDGAAPAAVPAGPQLESPPVTLRLQSLRDDGRVTVDGRMRNLVCGADTDPLVVEFASPSGVLRLLIDDRDAITVVGVDGGMVDLQCGAQDVPLRIGYVPSVDTGTNTVGRVRLLDYQMR